MSRLGLLEYMGGHAGLNNPLYLKGTPLALLPLPPFFSIVPSSSLSTSSSITTTVPHPKQNPPIYSSPAELIANMPQDASGIPVHPVAPRLAKGPKTPHIGPDIKAYHAAHAETIGHESDHWWAKVRGFSHLHYFSIPIRSLCSPFPRRYLTVT